MQKWLLLFTLFITAAAGAQQVGTKVILKGADGKWYTGAVAELRGTQCRVVYDNTDFEAWLTADQFTIAANPTQYTRYKTEPAAEQPTNRPAATAPVNNTNVPTVEDIKAAMRQTWEQSGASGPRVTVSFANVTIGASRTANLQQVYDGVPKGAMVTTAKIDFTATTHYSGGPQNTRRIMTALVYRNDFKEWTVMNTGTVYPDK